jgi:hypothetical protein
MKVKVKKEGKKKTYNLIDSWEDVNLETWSKLIDLELGGKGKEATKTLELLSDMPQKLIGEMPLKDVAILMTMLAEMQKQQETELTKVIEIDGVEYGMHPNLSALTLGEFADLESLIKDGLQKNLKEMLAILFRPIIEQKDDVYTIEAYDGDISIRAEEMKKMSAQQVQNVLVFFWTFVTVFLKISPLYLQEQAAQIKAQQTETSQKSGGGSE